MVIGITGGTGSGKSTVSKIFSEYGFDIIDADEIARKVVEKGAPALSEIVSAFGDVLLPDGSLDRKKLGEIVFSDCEKRKLLNEITHKYIIEAIKKRITEKCVLDVPLLFESGLDKECSFVISVIAPLEERLKRIEKRDSLEPESAEKRIRAQLTDEEYIKRSDYVIINDKGIENLKNEVRKCIEEVLRLK